MIVVNGFLLLASGGLAGLFLLSKAFFLAPYRVGWLLMFANTVYSTFEIRYKRPRRVVDMGLFVLSVAGLAIVSPVAAVGLATVMALLWTTTMHQDIETRTGAKLQRQHVGFINKVPLPVPQLIVHVRGPILERGERHDLGTLPQGTVEDFTVFVLNPSIIRPQLPLQVSVSTSSSNIAVAGHTDFEGVCPEPGDVLEFPFQLSAASVGAGGDVAVRVSHGDLEIERTLTVRGVIEPTKNVVNAEIRRWKYGATAAFAWRGDHDLYDPATFQSEEGLRPTLGLSTRLRVPSTLFMSGKLSLVTEEHRAFHEHYGWERHSDEIPSFIEFLKENIDRRVENEWPFASELPYAAEFGNHMYLHYGTHTAADPENDWTPNAEMGAGRYEWQAEGESDSFTEQRDNLLANARAFDELLDTKMISFAIPSDVWDADTARACEAAGLEIGSDTDASTFTRVMKLPPPHHPDGCEHLVELTRKIPKDPKDAYALATLKFWAHEALRQGSALTMLSHHHLLRFEDSSCYHATEELLRSVLADYHGRFYVATMGAVGRYWRDVLSEQTRSVTIEQVGGATCIVNGSTRRIEGIPVDVTYTGGAVGLRLVDLDPGEKQWLNPSG